VKHAGRVAGCMPGGVWQTWLAGAIEGAECAISYCFIPEKNPWGQGHRILQVGCPACHSVKALKRTLRKVTQWPGRFFINH